MMATSTVVEFDDVGTCV